MKRSSHTLDVISAAHTRGSETVVAGEFADIRFPKGGDLSLLASKLFVQLLDRAALESLNWSRRDLETIEETVRELIATTVALSVNTPRGRRRLMGGILAHVDRPDGQIYAGELIFKFSKTFRAVVRRSNHWAATSARAVLAMECKYSPWLYQIAALHAGRERVSHDWKLDDLRERLGVSSPSLGRWGSFKERVLEPAITEINHLTGIGVTWEPLKHGRSVVAVRLFTWRKSKEELHVVRAELNRHRSGRKDRRADLAGQIAEERVALRRKLAAELQALPAFSRNAQDSAAD